MDGFREYAMQTLGVIHGQFGLVVVITGQHPAYPPLQRLHGGQAACEQGYPRRRPVAVAVGIAVYPVEGLPQKTVVGVMHPSADDVLRHGIHGKHIHINAAQVTEMEPFDEGRRGILHLAERQGVCLVVLRTDKLIGLGQPFAAVLDEPLIVRTRDHHVHVIIPGNEALVADGTQKAAVEDAIGDVVLTEGAVHHLHDFQHAHLQRTNIVSGHGLKMTE